MKCVKCRKQITEVFVKTEKGDRILFSTQCYNKKCKLYKVHVCDVTEENKKDNWLQKLLRRLL